MWPHIKAARKRWQVQDHDAFQTGWQAHGASIDGEMKPLREREILLYVLPAAATASSRAKAKRTKGGLKREFRAQVLAAGIVAARLV